MLGERRRRSSEQALREYGFNLGIAFQLVDDLLDFTGDAAALGKPIGGDLREGKMTLPIIHLLAAAASRGRRRIDPRDRRDARRHARAQWREMLGAAARAPRRSTTPTRAPSSSPSAPRSRSCAFPPSAERDALLALPDYVLSRDR